MLNPIPSFPPLDDAMARHSFTVPEADETAKKFNMTGLQYNKAADEKSWSDMQSLFKETLDKQGKE